jgi:His/Glu/Gln/Arg/opine family amino acid ABC transporter permease subunit
MAIAASGYVYNWSVVAHAAPQLLAGLRATVEIAAMSMICALALGLLVALCRMSPIRLLSWAAFAYIQVFRALSLFIYILWVYFGLAIVSGINLTPWAAAVVCLTLLYSAYMAEVYRAAIGAVDAGQREASKSLNLGTVRTLTAVIAPQAFRIAIPPLTNCLVDIVKDSSIVGIIGTTDLMYTTVQLVSNDNHAFEFYTVTGAIYLAIVLCVVRGSSALERRLNRYLVI